MKFLFSLLLCMDLKAREVIFISHDHNLHYANKVRQVLITKLFIPRKLILIKTQKDCTQTKQYFAHICISKESDLRFNYINAPAIKRTLGVFLDLSDE